MADFDRYWCRVTGALAVVVVLSIVGCVRSTAKAVRDSGGQRLSSPVVSPLTVSVTRPEQLSSINSLAIARPTFARDAVDRTLAEDALQPMLERVADRVLSLKVITAPSVGALRGADAVLLTELQVYRDRGGSAIGGDPATVAFTMRIQSASTGDDMWKAQYFYQQEALSDNWLKLGERLGAKGTGAGWASGSQVLERGVEAAISDFGARREAQFLVPAAVPAS